MSRNPTRNPALLIFALTLAAFTGITAAQQQQRESTSDAVVPVPREDDWWKQRHALLNQRAEENPDTRLIFIGDSITHGWENEGAQEVWDQHYNRYDPINLGISGDRTQHVLWRLENGNIEGISPEAAVVMIGTNNYADNSAAEIADGVTAIVDKLHSELPDTQVLLLAIFPRGEHPNPGRGKLLQTNQILRKLESRPYVHYLDIGHRFIDASGDIPKDIMPDALHPNQKGYQIWADAMEEELTRLLQQG